MRTTASSPADARNWPFGDQRTTLTAALWYVRVVSKAPGGGTRDLFGVGEDGVGNCLLNAAADEAGGGGTVVGLPGASAGDWAVLGSWSRGNVAEMVLPVGWSGWHLCACSAIVGRCQILIAQSWPHVARRVPLGWMSTLKTELTLFGLPWRSQSGK